MDQMKESTDDNQSIFHGKLLILKQRKFAPTLSCPGRFCSKWTLDSLVNTEACLVVECNNFLFIEPFMVARVWKGRKGKFFEEQKALEIILGCFLDSFFA